MNYSAGGSDPPDPRTPRPAPPARASRPCRGPASRAAIEKGQVTVNGRRTARSGGRGRRRRRRGPRRQPQGGAARPVALRSALRGRARAGARQAGRAVDGRRPTTRIAPTRTRCWPGCASTWSGGAARRGYVGPLHRLDRDTSGALAVALSREAHEAGRALFGAHELRPPVRRAGRRRAGGRRRHHRRADCRRLRVRPAAAGHRRRAVAAGGHPLRRPRAVRHRRRAARTDPRHRPPAPESACTSSGSAIRCSAIASTAATAGSRCRGRCCTPGDSPFRTR